MFKFSFAKNVNRFFSRKFNAVFTILFWVCSPVFAQNTYYIDGYHGGVWGHYPDWNTRFLVDMLQKHPYWKINVELEPETWDRAAIVDPSAYAEFKKLVSDANASRIEYVNPAYAQSYLYNIDGESIIRQFSYGIQKLQQHFPGITFRSYSSEEPCFTSALPQILQSFGIKYASLKNPNTCFGGYTAAHGGELVNWQGPDGTQILTVPRYEVEALLPKSTWQTIAWNNSPQYIDAAFKYGVRSPVGMTLQDAGWKGGPFLGDGDTSRQQNEYTTWRDYFNLVKNDPQPVWRLSQEDIKVSLVWGSQITQKIAQQVRTSENNLLGTEKLLSLTNLLSGKTAWPQADLDSAWRTLLLSQHHDCWIVPYNGKKGDTWADKVVAWTNRSNKISADLNRQALQQSAPNYADKRSMAVTVYNTQLEQREEPVSIRLPESMTQKNIQVTDQNGKSILSQTVTDSANHQSLLFVANTPGFGTKNYVVKEASSAAKNSGATVIKLKNGNYRLETNLYTIIINPKQGGSIGSLYAKKLQKEFIDRHNLMKFGSLRGNFYQDGGFKSSADQVADVKILENGPVRVKLQLKGKINGTAWTEIISLAENQQLIDLNLNLDWKSNVGIGEDTPKGTYKLTNYHKAFYDDRNKLLAVFPLNLNQQKVYKNAPFDVTESQLKDTFFSTWDSIKNNVILNWVDVTDGQNKYGMALFTDHTTSYAHGEHFPLGLTIQYSGMGLWGRDYQLNGPTNVHYALMPHEGKWDKAAVWSASARWNEPMFVELADSGTNPSSKSLITADKGLVLTSAKTENHTFTVRFFNAEGENGSKTIKPNFDFDTAELVDLNGNRLEILQKTGSEKDKSISLPVPKFCLRTIRFNNAVFMP
ncbi:MAG: glycoside hydrolase family 38 C-terminal domain-containing protein [Janthinobacterium lividum]